MLATKSLAGAALRVESEASILSKPKHSYERINPGFEKQCTSHQNSKIEVSVVTKRDSCPPIPNA